MMNNRSSLDTGLFYAGLSLPRGAGGARMWFDEVPEQRVSHFRVQEALRPERHPRDSLPVFV